MTQRDYQRLYMRRWRADPRNRKRKRANRERWHYERKVRDSQKQAPPVCFGCHGKPRCVVPRIDPYRWRPALLPWCGEC